MGRIIVHPHLPANLLIDPQSKPHNPHLFSKATLPPRRCSPKRWKMEQADQPENNNENIPQNARPQFDLTQPPTEEERRADAEKNRRKSVIDRRIGVDRRQQDLDPADLAIERRNAERRGNTGLERRRGPGRRRTDDRRSAEEGEMTTEQFEFCMAIETYKKVNRRLFPTWTEVLEVITQSGYRKVLPRNIQLENCPEPELHKTPA